MSAALHAYAQWGIFFGFSHPYYHEFGSFDIFDLVQLCLCTFSAKKGTKIAIL